MAARKKPKKKELAEAEREQKQAAMMRWLDKLDKEAEKPVFQMIFRPK